MVLDLSKKNQFTDWTFVGYLTGEFDFSDRSPKFQQAFKAAEYYAMYDTQNDAWHFSQDPLGVVKNNVSLRYPHWTVPYSESPYSGKEHLTVSREGKKPIHIYVGTLPSNNVISTFNSQLDAYINQYPDVIDYYAGEGSGVDCYLAHIRGLASKPIKKASDELRVIKKTLVQNEDNLLRVDEFIELLEIIKTKIANASSSDDVKYQLQILNNLMQEARQLLKTSVSNANSQAKQIKQEKLTKQVSKPKFDLSPLMTQITELSVALDMPFGTRGLAYRKKIEVFKQK